MVFAGCGVVKRHGLEGPVRGWQIGGSNLIHDAFTRPPVMDDLADAYYRDCWRTGVGGKPGFIEGCGGRRVDVRQHGHGLEPCQHGQVYRSLGVAQSSQHAAFAGPNRGNRTGRAEVGTIPIGRQGPDHGDFRRVV